MAAAVSPRTSKICGRALSSVIRSFTRSFQSQKLGDTSRTRPHIHSGWIKIGNTVIYPWTTAGLESCVVVGLSMGGNKKDLLLAFDMGYSCRASLQCQHVFISHGHMDHCSAIQQHASKRSLYGYKPAKYYLGHNLYEPMERIHENFLKISEFPFQTDMNIAQPNETIQLPGPYHIVPFKTIHRVPSMGFLVYKTISQLKDEFKTLKQQDIQKLKQNGEHLYDETVVPELAYTGDTRFEVFQDPPLPDLLKVNVLITECTYTHTTSSINVNVTRERGHIHLEEIAEGQELFSDVGTLMLVHFSDRYRTRDIEQSIKQMCPPKLKRKLLSASSDHDKTVIVDYRNPVSNTY